MPLGFLLASCAYYLSEYIIIYFFNNAHAYKYWGMAFDVSSGYTGTRSVNLVSLFRCTYASELDEQK